MGVLEPWACIGAQEAVALQPGECCRRLALRKGVNGRCIYRCACEVEGGGVEEGLWVEPLAARVQGPQGAHRECWGGSGC